MSGITLREGREPPRVNRMSKRAGIEIAAGDGEWIKGGTLTPRLVDENEKCAKAETREKCVTERILAARLACRLARQNDGDKRERKADQLQRIGQSDGNGGKDRGQNRVYDCRDGCDDAGSPDCQTADKPRQDRGCR